MPSPSPPPPPAAAPRIRSKSKGKLTVHVSVFKLMPVPLPKQDWAEDLPLGALLCILHKLGTVELLIGGAAGVCRAAREEPVLWGRIDMRDPRVPPFRPRVSLGIMVRQALRLSAGKCEGFPLSKKGKCEGFYGGEYLHDEALLYLADQAPSLKSLHLISSRVSYKVFAEAINKFPLLEELELSQCFYDINIIELVARVCPRLKHFRCIRRYFKIECHCCSASDNLNIDDRIAFAISKMHELRSLHLIGDDLSNKGLIAILDNCPHLEYINLLDCENINMEEDNLVEKCAGVYIDDYDYFPPERSYRDGDDFSITSCSDFGDDDVFNSYCLDDDVDDLELEEAERILDSKSMRRYLS